MYMFIMYMYICIYLYTDRENHFSRIIFLTWIAKFKPQTSYLSVCGGDTLRPLFTCVCIFTCAHEYFRNSLLTSKQRVRQFQNLSRIIHTSSSRGTQQLFYSEHQHCTQLQLQGNACNPNPWAPTVSLNLGLWPEQR